MKAIGEDLINKILSEVKANKSAKEIAISLGNVVKFEEFNDGVNQSRFIIEPEFGRGKYMVAVDNSGQLDWVSLNGKGLQIPFLFLKDLSIQNILHYNTYDSTTKIQFVFYPMKESFVTAIFTWIDESLVNNMRKEELMIDNVILHFSKKQTPIPSREWVYMI